MKKVIILLVSLAVFNAMNAQKLSITGTVTDSSGPLPGASVMVKGTNVGTQTDFDGKYSIVVNLGDILVFSFVGMQSQEKTAGKNSVIDVQLQSDHQLEEVVVIGYATSTRSATLSSSVRTIAPNQLSGQVAGVNIQGATGASPKVLIRGIASQKKNSPLVVVDGVPMQITSKQFKKLNKGDIKSVNVLKDKTASSIYGNRGSNGVIIISTNNDQYESEAYKPIKENEFKHVAFSPLSTFSIDVDKASYSNVRRFLNNGAKVPTDAVKIEELINYFNYNYKQPTDEHPFAIHTELANAPWDQESMLLKIGLQGKNINNDRIPASNLVFLIDVSGSMSDYNKLPLLKSAFKLLVAQLRKEDKVSIVVYAGAAGTILEGTSGSDKNTITTALENLEAGGSTAGGAGLKLAYSIAQKHFIKNGNNRVILATDGDFNVGLSSDTALERLITKKRDSDIFLTALGFGMGNYKDATLEILANKGNGNHAYIDTLQEANRILGEEFGGTLYTIAKDVKIQIEFNPAVVEAYRLIGYENRLLENEDFIDDTKDAGELGSNHSVTALYEVIPKGTRSKFLNAIGTLKYAKTTVNSSFKDELATVKFRYKQPTGDQSIELSHTVVNKSSEFAAASTNLRFATAVALFGMKLRKSKFLDSFKYQDIHTIAYQSKGNDPNGYRSEFLKLLKMAEVSN